MRGGTIFGVFAVGSVIDGALSSTLIAMLFIFGFGVWLAGSVYSILPGPLQEYIDLVVPISEWLLGLIGGPNAEIVDGTGLWAIPIFLLAMAGVFGTFALVLGLLGFVPVLGATAIWALARRDYEFLETVAVTGTYVSFLVVLLPVGKRLSISIAQAAQAGNGWLALAITGIGGVYLLGVTVLGARLLDS